MLSRITTLGVVMCDGNSCKTCNSGACCSSGTSNNIKSVSRLSTRAIIVAAMWLAIGATLVSMVVCRVDFETLKDVTTGSLGVMAVAAFIFYWRQGLCRKNKYSYLRSPFFIAGGRTSQSKIAPPFIRSEKYFVLFLASLTTPNLTTFRRSEKVRRFETNTAYKVKGPPLRVGRLLGAGSRTRTYEAERREIYSLLWLPLHDSSSSELTFETSFRRKWQKLRLFVVPPLKLTNR